MKNTLKLFLALFAAAALLNACKKDENRVTLESGTPPVLSASRTGIIPLSFSNAGQEAIRLMWTNPNYKFTTGASSQNVNYALEIDTAGANFGSRIKRSISISSDLSKTYTQAEFNDLLLNQMERPAGRAVTLEMRVIATLGSGAAPLTSNVLRVLATPYAIPPKVDPYTNEVYVVGNATPGDWNNPVPVPSQKMTQLSSTLYEITLPLTANNSMLFLPENGSWSRKYGFDGSNNSNNQDGDNFRREGGDIKAPAVSGTYKIELNFQTGRFKFTKI